MKTISSFKVDHSNLASGVYVSRMDKVGGESVVTYDIRITRPNKEPSMTSAAAHSLEHYCATLMRNNPKWGEDVIYFGTMGCLTGCYLIVKGEHTGAEVVHFVKSTFNGVVNWQGAIPGGKKEECGNYRLHDTNLAKWYAKRFVMETPNGLSEYKLL